MPFLALSLYAQLNQFISAGYSNGTVESDSGSGYNIAWGVSKIKTDSFYWGILFGYESISIDNVDITGFSGDLQLGYTPIKNLSVYAIGSALTQSIDSITGYGFGASYKINDNYSVNIDYKSYNMITDYTTYDYSTTTAKTNMVKFMNKLIS